MYEFDPLVKEILERLSRVEKRKIAVKDLPIGEIRTKLEEQPSDPVDLLLPKSITDDLLADSSVGQDQVVNPEGWTSLTLINNWTAYTDANFNLGLYVRRSVEGLVSLKGLVQQTVGGANGTSMAVLPEGYRPSKYLVTNAMEGTSKRVTLRNDGNIYYEGGTDRPTWVALDNIHFWTD